MTHNILIIEDNEAICELIFINLKYSGFNCIVCDSAKSALKYLEDSIPDCIIIDLMLPEIPGLKLLKLWQNEQKFKNIPIIALTPKRSEKVLTNILNIGADDCISEPFSFKDLIAKVQILLNEKNKKISSNKQIKSSGLICDLASLKIIYNNKEIDIGLFEAKILNFLITNKNKVFSSKNLLKNIWNNDKDINELTTQTHIYRLKKHLQKIGAEEFLMNSKTNEYKWIEEASNE